MSKGGVGKSLVSSLTAQYLVGKGSNVYCADTDPLSATFSRYQAIGAKHINILTHSMCINRAKFDDLFEDLIVHQGPCVVDNSASSFIPILSYMFENNVIQYLSSIGRRIIIHAPLVGGEALIDTARCLDYMMRNLDAKVLVWENEYFGPINLHGLGFSESKLFLKNSDRIIGIIKIPGRSSKTFGADLRKMTTDSLTFEQAQSMPGEFQANQRRRLAIFQDDINAQLDQVKL